MTTIVERRVRVTLEGPAHPVRVGSSMLRVYYSDNTQDGSVLVDADAPSVTVEDVAVPRTWTCGDVVLGCVAWQRDASGWWHSASPDTGTMEDSTVTASMDAGNLRVLRYQAGGDQ